MSAVYFFNSLHYFDKEYVHETAKWILCHCQMQFTVRQLIRLSVLMLLVLSSNCVFPCYLQCVYCYTLLCLAHFFPICTLLSYTMDLCVCVQGWYDNYLQNRPLLK